MCTRASGRPAHLPAPAVSPEGSGTLAMSRDGNGLAGKAFVVGLFLFFSFHIV